MISNNQIRAARALINLSQGDLAQKTGISTPTIANIELGKQKPSAATIDKIMETFLYLGVIFTETGVELRQQEKITIIKSKFGRSIYVELIEDVLFELKSNPDFHQEVLYFNADDSVAPDEVNKAIQKLYDHGIEEKVLIGEGNTHIMGPIENYRYIPEDYYINEVVAVYADKVAIAVESDAEKGTAEFITIIKDQSLSQSMRNTFYLLWSFLKAPSHSTADETFKITK